MRDFFKGWKRKAGVVTLAIACVFAAGWVRSLSYRDQIVLPEFNNRKEGFLHSQDGLFRWSRGYRQTVRGSTTPLWMSRRINNELSSIGVKDGPGVHWWFRFAGFSLGTFGGEEKPRSFCYCHYWMIVLPLTLLSAYLLLSKPRPQDSLLRMAEHQEQS